MKRNLSRIDEEEEGLIRERKGCCDELKRLIVSGWIRWIEYLYGIERDI